MYKMHIVLSSCKKSHVYDLMVNMRLLGGQCGHCCIHIKENDRGDLRPLTAGDSAI